jgi:hypothetical protein
MPCQLLYNQKQRIPDSHRSPRFNCVASRVAGRGKQQLDVRAGRISDNVPGLPACRASGMSAGPLLLDSPIRSPAAAPRTAARAGTCCYLECASCFSPQVRAPIPGLLPHQLLHTTLERASRGKHVRFLSTGSAPPPAQWRHQGPRKAGRLHVHSPHHSPTHRPTARVSRPPRSLIQHRQRVRRRSSAAHKARTCRTSIRSIRVPRS